MIHHRLIRSLARGRLWACGVLGAMPREAHRGEIQREAAALRTSEAECDRLGELLEASQANERRLVDQLQRLETALNTEQGLRAHAERAAIEVIGLRAEVDKRQRCEEELREQQHRALTELRSQTDTNYRLLAIPARALCSALDGGDLPCVANTALGNLRRALGMVP